MRIATPGNIIQTVNSPNQYMSTPGNAAKMEPHTATHRQYKVIRPLLGLNVSALYNIVTLAW